MKQKYQELLEAMYLMLLPSTNLELDMDDYQVMWEALMERWGIEPPSQWEEFIEDINCSASGSYKYFETKFWQYFYIKPIKTTKNESI